MSVASTDAGTVHPNPFIGPTNFPASVRVDVSELSSDEVDEFGFLKPGVILTRSGLLAGSDGVLLEAGGVAISATPEEFLTATTLDVIINGRQVTVAADATIPLSAAHVVTTLLFGAILLQVTAAGAISSKVVSVTQAYASAALAIAAMPKADDDNAAIGRIVINADSGDWTAITDDMTDASDLTTAVFTDAAIEQVVQNAQRGYGAVIEATKVAAGNTDALLAAAVDIDVALSTICMINRDIMEDSLARSLTAEELYNLSDSIVITST
jgi:hypothetical protein